MKNKFFVSILIALLLVACGNESTFEFTMDEYETTITGIVNENKSNSFIEIKPKSFDSGDYYTMKLTDRIQVVIERTTGDKVKSVSVLADSLALGLNEKELKIAFQSLIQSVDPSLDVIQQLTVMDKLEMNWGRIMLDNRTSYSTENIQYTFVGDPNQSKMLFKAVPNE